MLPELAFLHTAAVHVDTFERLVRRLAPGMPTRHLVDTSLLAEALAPGLTAPLAARVRLRLESLLAAKPALVLATVASTLLPTRQLIEATALALGKTTACRVLLVPGAWERFVAGDMAAYEDRIRQCIAANLEDVDAIVLAQASMAGAVTQTMLKNCPVPLLSSPGLAVEAALRLM